MTTSKNKPNNLPLLEKLHISVKLLICAAIAVAAYLLIQVEQIDTLTHVMLGWDIFSLLTIIQFWITFTNTNSHQIRERSKTEDSSRIVIFLIILIATLASLLAVLLLIVTKEKFKNNQIFHLIISVGGMIMSWFLIHTIFTARYAHIYYGDSNESHEVHAGGLDFPGDKRPDYLDFAYFSFVLGMTFQVSDVQITSQRIRRLATWHGLLSFGYNTIMIALTINLIAGFSI